MGDIGAVRTTLKMEEFLALAELEAGRRELLDGKLIGVPLSQFGHAEIAHRPLKILETVAVAAGMRGKVFHEIGYQLEQQHWLKPDLSITHPDQPVAYYLLGAPQLAVEIISPSNSAAEINSKIDAYLGALS